VHWRASRALTHSAAGRAEAVVVRAAEDRQGEEDPGGKGVMRDLIVVEFRFQTTSGGKAAH
jgi:hypothetical protein